MSVRLGVIGTNFVSDWLSEAVTLTDGITLDAVYSRKTGTGEAFAKKHAVSKVFTSLDAFLSSGIDAVYIASPSYLHASHAMASLEGGLHVLCEKPLVMCGKDYRALSDKANEKGVVFMEAMRPAHDPVFWTVKESLETLGAIRRVSFEYCQYSSRYDRFLSGEVLNAFTPAISGGALFDIGIYPLFWCTALFGKPKTVKASSTFLANGFEGGGTLLLDYGSFQATVTYSKICDSVTPSVIMGEKGALTVDKLTSPTEIRVYPRKKEARVLDCTSVPNNLIYEVRDFVSLIEGGEDRFAPLTKTLYETLDMALFAAGITVYPTYPNK